MSKIVVIAFGIILSNAIQFEELPIYTLQDGETYYLRAEYCTISNTEFTMNGRCWSFKGPDQQQYTQPTSPGPTLKMIAGTTFTIILENNFINSVQEEPDCHNSYCEMDMINLHLHGLHISSSQDDVLVDLKPRVSNLVSANQYSYTYTIPDDHYPGVHWYHPHNHGSVSHQIHFGLFGAIITEYADNSNYGQATGSTALYTDGGDESYMTNILVFSSVYAVNTSLCDCGSDIVDVEILDGETNAERETVGAYGRCSQHGKTCFHIYSVCYEYCKFEGSKDTSGLEYDVKITSDNEYDQDGIDQFVIVNGIYNPTIEITVGKYRRLQLVNTLHQYYIHYQFPEECDIYLLGYDGIFFDNERSLEQYFYELILSAGSRGDLLIKCDTIDQYEIVTISLPTQSDNTESDFDSLERFGSDQSEERKKLFTISVVNDVIDTISDLPQSFPAKPNYLKDLQNIDDEDVYNNCACNQFDEGDEDCPNTECCIHYNSKTDMFVNQEEYSSSDRYLTYLIQDRVYEFTLKTDRHVHHQHVYPFQLLENIGDNGFIGNAGDFFDTLGAENTRVIRTYTADFSGYMMLHCHILPHEDMGMMALFYVLSSDQANGIDTPSPVSAPTEQCLDDLNLGQSLTIDSDTDTSDGTTTTPAPTVKTKGKNKGSSSSIFDFNFEIKGTNIILTVLFTIFICLTLFNTLVICKSRPSTKKIRNKTYGMVVQKDIDDIEENV